MNRGQRGRSNEHRTIQYLAKQNWIGLRAGASKGMGDTDVIAVNIFNGTVKLIQSKSNGHYTEKDLDVLRMVRRMTIADNVSFELWDWYDNDRTPRITIIHAEKEN